MLSLCRPQKAFQAFSFECSNIYALEQATLVKYVQISLRSRTIKRLGRDFKEPRS